MRGDHRHRRLRRGVTRRDFLNGVALGSGSLLLGGVPPLLTRPLLAAPGAVPGPGWYGYGGVGDYRHSHGNTPEAVATAHDLRDVAGRDAPLRGEPAGHYDLVIVGCGVAGLGAALEFIKRRAPGQTCLMLDNHPVFGGEAKENAFDVDGQRLIAPQGANGFFVPDAVSNVEQAAGDPRYYADLGIPREFALRDWPEDRKPLRFSADNYEYLVQGLAHHTSVGNFFPSTGGGTWAVDMFLKDLENTPMPKQRRQALLAWHATGAVRRYASRGEAIRVLDGMSYERFVVDELGLEPEGARYADLFIASAVGLGSDAVSAYAASQLPMPGLADVPAAGLRRSSFPGGNSGFVRHFVKRLIPDAIAGRDRFDDVIIGNINFDALDRAGQPVRMRLGATALDVAHDGDPVTAGAVKVTYRREGKLYSLRAGAVIMATGGWINRYVVRDMPADYRKAYRQFVHAPFLVANVALTNWRFLERLGITAAIWDGADAAFGYTCNIRNPMQVGDYQPPLDPNKPVVLSFYTPYHRPGLPAVVQVARGRAELLTTSYAEYEQRIVEQMNTLFAAHGFRARRDIAGVILNRWGHAYSVPVPGFFGGPTGTAPRDTIRQNYGRIAFAHSELDGLQHWGPAADEGRRAFSQLVDAL